MTGEYSLVLGTGVSMRLDRRNAQPDSDEPLWLLTRPLPADSEQLGQSQSLVDLDEDTTGLELWETAAFRLCRWVDDSSLAGRAKLAQVGHCFVDARRALCTRSVGCKVHAPKPRNLLKKGSEMQQQPFGADFARRCSCVVEFKPRIAAALLGRRFGARSWRWTGWDNISRAFRLSQRSQVNGLAYSGKCSGARAPCRLCRTALHLALCALLGASHVTLSDYTPPTLAVLEHNVLENQLQSCCTVRRIDIAAERPLGSDLTYARSALP